MASGTVFRLPCLFMFSGPAARVWTLCRDLLSSF